MTRSDDLAGYIKKVEWTIWLYHVDLNSLTDGGWLKLKEELYDFFTADLEWTFASKAKPLTKEDVVALARLIESSEIRFDNYPQIEDALEEHDYARLWALDERDKDEWVKVVDAKTVERTQAALKAILDDALTQTSFLHPDEDSDFYYHYHPSHSTEDDSLPDIAIARLRSYLVAAGIEPAQIRTCDECKTIFLAKRKPTPKKKSYCSARCAQLCATRAYRKRNQAKLKTKERERSHHRYVAKQRKKHPNAKVKRIPRARSVDTL